LRPTVWIALCRHLLSLVLCCVAVLGLHVGLAAFTDVDHAFLRVANAAVTGATIHRNHVRRHRRRAVTVLPAGCRKVVRRRVTYYRCGSIYYRPYYQGTTVVYVVESPEDE